MIDLDQLRILLGDEKLLHRYISLFIVSGPTILQKIQDSFDQNDLEAMVVATHSLKTQFAYLGHDEGHKITLFLENLRMEQVSEQDISVVNAIKSLSNILEKTIKELNEYTTT